jgi:hypothetical protein
LLDEYIVAIGIDYILLQLLGSAIRIIGETGPEFGTNYEDVEVCGKMSDPVHDDL